MLTLDRILVPTDFSATAADAVRRGGAMARRLNADLHVLHVTRGRELSALVRRLMEADTAAAERLVRHASDWLGLTAPDGREGTGRTGPSRKPEPSSTPPGQFVRAVRRARVPPDGILSYAREIAADLIVIGTSGRAPGRGPWLGSVADRVIRRARCSVVTVRPDLATPPAGRSDAPARRRIVVPIDFSGATRSLVAHAKHWAETFGATVSFLHVVGRQDSSTPTRDEPPPAQNDPQTTNARSRLAATVEATEGPDVNTDTRVLTGGDVASRIVQYAETQRARFLLMAAHGLSNLRRYLLGGVTDRVIRRAPCPVCTLKSYEQSLITTT